MCLGRESTGLPSRSVILRDLRVGGVAPKAIPFYVFGTNPFMGSLYDFQFTDTLFYYDQFRRTWRVRRDAVDALWFNLHMQRSQILPTPLFSSILEEQGLPPFPPLFRFPTNLGFNPLDHDFPSIEEARHYIALAQALGRETLVWMAQVQERMERIAPEDGARHHLLEYFRSITWDAAWHAPADENPGAVVPYAGGSAALNAAFVSPAPPPPSPQITPIPSPDDPEFLEAFRAQLTLAADPSYIPPAAPVMTAMARAAASVNPVASGSSSDPAPSTRGANGMDFTSDARDTYRFSNSDMQEALRLSAEEAARRKEKGKDVDMGEGI
ncbi:hypothetical protein EIP91_012377 [Steccherinum ochraceum]|uniref:Uncharacterized protein n=1 Tax=Steccherinum ochraceum TaxID=92696 RepID=A0A4R0RGC6_9APHY|nr:hypothetical protein EIP91_012377 [Steccherinum ochraceum]